MADDDHIKHVVLLMLENRSFDQVLGCFQRKYPDLEGVDPNIESGDRRYNADSHGTKYYQQPGATKQTSHDPRHEVCHVAVQIKNGNTGFVLDYEKDGAAPAELQQVMSYYDYVGDRDLLPASHALADNFTICDRWFSSLPGPTWPNRFFALSGTSSGKVAMPEGFEHPDLKGFVEQTQDTIFDRLYEAGKDYRIYFYDFPCSLVLSNQRKPHQLAHYRDIAHFFDTDVHDAQNFPDFVFIEPKYSGLDQNDDHPPHNVVKGEKLIADVYNAIRTSEIWESTLLIVAFDEHGGFYDHVTPPKAIPPRPYDPEKDEYTFDQLGIRVPAILVSPWVSAGVEHTVFDHTSILKYLIEKWELDGLGDRTASAKSIGVALTDSCRDDTPSFIRVPYTDLVPDDIGLEKNDVSKHQVALRALSVFLATELKKTSGALQRRGLDTAAEASGVIERLKSIFGWSSDQGVDGSRLNVLLAYPSTFERVKSWIGSRLVSLGNYLTRGVEEQNDRRAEAMKDTIEGLIFSAHESAAPHGGADT